MRVLIWWQLRKLEKVVVLFRKSTKWDVWNEKKCKKKNV